MSKTEKSKREDDLERFFAAARHAAPHPSSDLMRRISADATREQPAPARPTAGRSRGRLALFLSAIGGLPVAAGLAAATVAGLWIGYSDPGIVPLNAVTSEATYDLGPLLPGYGNDDGWSG